MSHCDVLTKCIEYAWEGAKGTYYLSDASGSKISDEDLPLRCGKSNQCVPWSLGNYMRACNIYASRTRLYCVRIGMLSYSHNIQE